LDGKKETRRKKRINAEVAESAESAEKSGGREKEIPQPQLGGCAAESNPRGRSELRPYKGEG
jgi:hypothetical protein